MDLEFGRYRRTSDTVVRPPKPRFDPRYTVPQQVHDATRRIERADEAIGTGALRQGVTLRLLRDAMSRNAFGTASIEGNPLSLEDVESLLAAGPTPEALDTPDEREILNHAALLQELPKRRAPRTPADVALLHGDLFAGVLADAGVFKDRPNFIGKRPEYAVTFVPAMPDRVMPELQNALHWHRDANEHPVVRSLVFFHEFQSIHPFRDGNGRAGRAILHLQLFHQGYRGIRFAFVDYLFNEDRQGYYQALQAGDRGDLGAWILYGANLLAEAFDDARRRIVLGTRLAEAPERQIHVAEYLARVARGHLGRRVKFADVHAAFPEVAERTLKRDLAALRDAGVLEAQGSGKGTTYRFSARS